MGRKGEEKRQRIVDAANTLIYHKGFTATSFADIAETCSMPKGNFYFYFHTKEELLDAVVKDRMKRLATHLDKIYQDFPDPRLRLHRIVNVPFFDRHDVALYGCPMGTLSAELGKQTNAGTNAITTMFTVLLLSIRHCLDGIGMDHAEAERQALHVLARLQGAANLTHAFKNASLLEAEIESLHAWIDAL